MDKIDVDGGSTMKHSFSILAMGLIWTLSMNLVHASPPEDIQEEARNSFIFQFSPTVTNSEIPGLAARLTSDYNGALRHVFVNILNGFSASMSRANALRLVEENDEVTLFVNNGVAHVPNDAGAGGAKGGKGKPPPSPEPDSQIESWGVVKIGHMDGTPEDLGGGRTRTRHAWIIDTGIDDYYTDTELNIGEGANFVSRGKDTTDDTNGHGTHIAGILAAKDNTTGVLGIASGATVHPVRVLHKNLWGTVDDIIKGVEYVTAQIPTYPSTDVHVVNMSLTIEIAGQEELAAMFDTVMDGLIGTGVNIAVCAGNDGADVSGYTPANSSDPHVFTVASVDEGINLASDSNYGTADQIDFVAPGVRIESLKPGGGTWFWSGCSMAAPHVAGILLFKDTPSTIGTEPGTGFPLAGF